MKHSALCAAQQGEPCDCAAPALAALVRPPKRPAREDGRTFEATVNGETYDPVLTVIVRTAYHDYEFDPAQIEQFILKEIV